MGDAAPPWEQAGAADMYHVPMAKPAKLTEFVFTVEVFSRSKEMQAAFDRNRSSSPSLAPAPCEGEEADALGWRSPRWRPDRIREWRLNACASPAGAGAPHS